MSPVHKLLDDVEVNQALNPKEHAVGAIAGTAIDGSKFDRALFILAVGDISTGGGIDAEIKQSATSGGTYTTIAGSGITELLDTVGDNLTVAIDVPIATAMPWMKITGTAATAAVLAGGSCLLYRGQAKRPPTQGATEVVTV